MYECDIVNWLQNGNLEGKNKACVHVHATGKRCTVFMLPSKLWDVKVHIHIWPGTDPRSNVPYLSSL